jgi:hypothetical protein
VIDGDVSAFFRKYLGNALADPLAGSRNERYFIAELHLYSVGFPYLFFSRQML